jgi:hypothetical protein
MSWTYWLQQAVYKTLTNSSTFVRMVFHIEKKVQQQQNQHEARRHKNTNVALCQGLRGAKDFAKESKDLGVCVCVGLWLDLSVEINKSLSFCSGAKAQFGF